MTDLALTDDLFFTKTGMDQTRVEKIIAEALQGMDDGELFLEYSQSESLTLDDGRIKSAAFDTAQGFGLRAVSGEATGYAHASELSEEAIQRAAQTVRAVTSGHSGSVALSPARTNRKLYVDIDPLQPFRHSPLKYSPATSAASLQARFAHQREHPGFFAGFDHDQRKARGEEHFQLAARILRHGRGSHAAENVAELAVVPCHAVTFF